MALNPANVEKVNLDSLLNVSELATELRKTGEEVDLQFRIDEIKNSWTSKVLAAAKIKGEGLTEEQARTAVEQHFSDLYRFKAPENSQTLANLYVSRGKIAKRVGIPAVIILGLAGLVNSASNAIHNFRLNAAESSIEAKVEEEYNLRQRFVTDLNTVLSDAEKEKIRGEDSEKLFEISKITRERLKKTDEFFGKYCKDGTAVDDVTRENYLEAGQQIVSVKNELESVGRSVEEGKGIVNFQRELSGTRNNLEAAIQEIRNTNPPQVFSQRAEGAYRSGLACLDQRQLDQAKSYGKQLGQIRGDAQDFYVLPTEVENTYSAIKSIVKEREAAEIAARLYETAKSDINSVNVPALKKDAQDLGNLNHNLGLEYFIKVVSRSGVKSGIDRYYTDKQGRRASGFYLIVEALDLSGNTLSRPIRNEEDGQTYNVGMWGERVPKSIYEGVKSDKMDDGIIQNDTFGKKEKGYLKEKILFPEIENAKRGQITSW